VTAALISRTDDSGLFYVVVLTATLGLSVFSYQFIERPIHEPREVRRGADRRTAAYAALAAAALLVTTLALYAFKPAPRAGNYTAPIPKITQTSIAAPAIAPNPKIGQQITEALQSTSFPTLNPSLDSLGLSAAEAQWAPCEYGGTVRQSCMFGPPRTHKTALVMGDSVSLAWMPAITHALPKWRVVGIARQQCAAAYVEEKAFTTGQRDTVCDRVHASYARTLASVKPDLVIMSSTEGTLQQLVNHDTPAAEQYTRGMTRTIRLAQQAGAEVVVLSPPPRTRSLVDCDTSGGSPSDCVQPIEDAWFTQSSLDSAVAQKTHATYINTRRWFCSLRGYCPAFIGKTPVTYDGAHLTTAFAVRTAPEFAASLPHR
jgi:hypothetical protein